MPFPRAFTLFSLCLALVAPVHAAVTRVEITEQRDLGKTGYEQLTGRLHLEIDPSHARNRVIADVELAPLNAAGKVEFSADLRLFRPKDPACRNGAAWVEIPNRGGKAGLTQAMMKQGFVLLNVGWEFDVPPQDDKLRIVVPAARHKDGRPVQGIVSTLVIADKKDVEELKLIDLAKYPPVDPNGPDRRLRVRTHNALAAGQDIPRDQWSLGDGVVRLRGGFEPGKIYEVSYLAENPPVAGLGFAAIRDAVAWLKHADDSLAPIHHAYAFGSSQCGRFLREFIYHGFNTDEQERATFDGVLAHVAGAGRLVFNQRWSTPRSVSAFQTASYPFADTAQTDPVSGLKEGILENPRVTHAPKIFYVNTAAEYWGAGRVAALTHTDPTGTQDIALPDNVRSYFFAGTQHGPAKFPPTPPAADGLMRNPVNANPVVATLREALHRWVTQGTPPPPSVYPKLSDGTLTPVSKIRFPAVPDIAAPNAVKGGERLFNPLLPNGAGAGVELPLLVPQVDADGNDLGGIRMPDVSVPLGTSIGWVFRPASMGQPRELLLLQGAWVPFPRTRAERQQKADPRPSLEERYANKDAYLEQVKKALQQLIQEGYLNESDLEPQLTQASERWDWVMSAP